MTHIDMLITFFCGICIGLTIAVITLAIAYWEEKHHEP